MTLLYINVFLNFNYFFLLRLRLLWITINLISQLLRKFNDSAILITFCCIETEPDRSHLSKVHDYTIVLYDTKLQTYRIILISFII